MPCSVLWTHFARLSSCVLVCWRHIWSSCRSRDERGGVAREEGAAVCLATRARAKRVEAVRLVNDWSSNARDKVLYSQVKRGGVAGHGVSQHDFIHLLQILELADIAIERVSASDEQMRHGAIRERAHERDGWRHVA